MTDQRPTGPPADHHIGFFKLLEFMEQPGCPVCRMAQAEIIREMEHFLYESVNDPELRRRMRADGGLCPAHGELLAEKSDALAGSILVGDWLAAALDRLKESGKAGTGAAGRSAAPCHFCRLGRAAQRRIILQLADNLADDQLQARWSGPVLLCVTHLQTLAYLTRHRTIFQQVFALHVERKYQHLLEQMALTVAKHDYQRTGEPLGEERNAWRTALTTLCGTTGQAR